MLALSQLRRASAAASLLLIRSVQVTAHTPAGLSPIPAPHDDARQTPRAGVEGGRPESGLRAATTREMALRGGSTFGCMFGEQNLPSWPKNVGFTGRRAGVAAKNLSTSASRPRRVRTILVDFGPFWSILARYPPCFRYFKHVRTSTMHHGHM